MQGLSFLEMKYHMLLSYLINLTYVVLRKCSGKMIEGDPAIGKLLASLVLCINICVQQPCVDSFQKILYIHLSSEFFGLGLYNSNCMHSKHCYIELLRLH
jgi:hypothetical protein